MKTSLEHLPEPKREQLAAIAALLQAEAPVDMVILFGSYARGDWVEDAETGYRSDFDVRSVSHKWRRRQGMGARMGRKVENPRILDNLSFMQV